MKTEDNYLHGGKPGQIWQDFAWRDVPDLSLPSYSVPNPGHPDPAVIDQIRNFRPEVVVFGGHCYVIAQGSQRAMRGRYPALKDERVE